LDEQLKEYINDWRKQRAKEEEELKKLKEQQAARKEIRWTDVKLESGQLRILENF
jgi:troponin T